MNVVNRNIQSDAFFLDRNEYEAVRDISLMDQNNISIVEQTIFLL